MRMLIAISLLVILPALAHDPFDYVISREVAFVMADPDSVPESHQSEVFPVGNERVTVDFSLDDGQTWPLNVAYGIWPQPGTNTVPWHLRVTPATWTETARIRVRTLWEDAGNNTEPPTFHGGIIGPRFTIGGIRITQPADGSSVAVPTYLPIQFQKAGPDHVDIGISYDGEEFDHLVTLSVEGAGLHDYELPLAHDVSHGPMWIVVAATGMPDLHDLIQVTITGW